MGSQSATLSPVGGVTGAEKVRPAVGIAFKLAVAVDLVRPGRVRGELVRPLCRVRIGGVTSTVRQHSLNRCGGDNHNPGAASLPFPAVRDGWTCPFD